MQQSERILLVRSMAGGAQAHGRWRAWLARALEGSAVRRITRQASASCPQALNAGMETFVTFVPQAQLAITAVSRPSQCLLYRLESRARLNPTRQTLPASLNNARRPHYQSSCAIDSTYVRPNGRFFIIILPLFIHAPKPSNYPGVTPKSSDGHHVWFRVLVELLRHRCPPCRRRRSPCGRASPACSRSPVTPPMCPGSRNRCASTPSSASRKDASAGLQTAAPATAAGSCGCLSATSPSARLSGAVWASSGARSSVS